MGRPGQEFANPLTGERVLFLTTAEESGGDLFAGETFVPAGGPEQPLHFHYRRRRFRSDRARARSA